VRGIRLLRAGCAGVVAAIAAWSSYWHMVHVALRYGERPEVAYVLPLSVDGVLTVAAIVMSEDRRTHKPVRPIATIAFVTGLGASIAANVSAAHPSTGGRLIAAWPAVALFLIVDMLVHVHPTTTGIGQNVGAGVPGEVPPGPNGDSDRPGGTRADVPHPRPEHPEAGRNNSQDAGQVPASRTRRAARRPTVVTRRLAADIMAAQPDLSREDVAARLGITPRRLRTVLTTAVPDGDIHPGQQRQA
jgi:Protein of unknown function (DUF2637)